MNRNFKEFTLQALIDLLAKETEEYTKANNSGSQKEVERHRAKVNVLVAEINRRKQKEFVTSNTDLQQPIDNRFETPS